ncbi:prohibitin family protein, SPFH superfamily [Campylobacter avium LMG 24591]|uniref:Prohibitin family protein, SPFH superfamily n=1 Tax=Campylobacter avium LMG 24591 TaxID=522484 RepID=A0A222N059_9BACT|nr:prohibitin family protein [Campylobacter avium]ASQ31226.1 prohibitin family protein, SPFH superfamily [Campylobacter avium LMG 24591]OYD79900.1 prohibitin family protein, SPFH superfamily [Campylobacter avium]HJE66226.1 prohibitin family protein [Campylobacter avium]
MPADLNDYFKKKSNSNNENKSSFNFKAPNINFKGFGKASGFIYAAIIIILVLVLIRPFAIVNEGEMGIKVTTGSYDPEPLKSGLHFFVPIFQKIIIVDTRQRQMTYTSSDSASSFAVNSGIVDKASISVLDSRGLTVLVNITVKYSLNPTEVPRTIAMWNLNWENKIIDPTVRDVVQSVIGKYTAEELPANRNAIASQINEGITKTISSLQNNPVHLQDVHLREIILPPSVKEQIEKVQIARQEAERATQEAIRRATLAEGEANATIISAKGKADAARIEADAQAYANKEVANSLNTPLLNLRQIEVQGKFNEALKANTDAKIFLTPGGAVPNIWVDTKDAKKQSSTGAN